MSGVAAKEGSVLQELDVFCSVCFPTAALNSTTEWVHLVKYHLLSIHTTFRFASYLCHNFIVLWLIISLYKHYKTLLILSILCRFEYGVPSGDSWVNTCLLFVTCRLLLIRRVAGVWWRSSMATWQWRLAEASHCSNGLDKAYYGYILRRP